MQVKIAKATDKIPVLNLLNELETEIRIKERPLSKKISVSKVGDKLFDQIIHKKDLKIFLAIDKNKIVGVTTFHLLPSIRHGRFDGHIGDFVVTKKLRGKGIGSLLLNEIKKYCKKNGIKVIKLESGNPLTKAHHFYEMHGGVSRSKMFRFDL